MQSMYKKCFPFSFLFRPCNRVSIHIFFFLLLLLSVVHARLDRFSVFSRSIHIRTQDVFSLLVNSTCEYSIFSPIQFFFPISFLSLFLWFFFFLFSCVNYMMRLCLKSKKKKTATNIATNNDILCNIKFFMKAVQPQVEQEKEWERNGWHIVMCEIRS